MVISRLCNIRHSHKSILKYLLHIHMRHHWANSLFSTSVWILCLISLFSTSVLILCLISLFSTSVLILCLISLFSTSVLILCLISLFSTSVLILCLINHNQCPTVKQNEHCQCMKQVLKCTPFMQHFVKLHILVQINLNTCKPSLNPPPPANTCHLASASIPGNTPYSRC